MGPPSAESALRECLGLGVDRLMASAASAAAFAFVLLASYLPYGVFPDWAYLRFLLPALPTAWALVGALVGETVTVKVGGKLDPKNNDPIEVTGKVVLDVGASTGGFTDCVLQAGAADVLAGQTFCSSAGIAVSSGSCESLVTKWGLDCEMRR